MFTHIDAQMWDTANYNLDHDFEADGYTRSVVDDKKLISKSSSSNRSISNLCSQAERDFQEAKKRNIRDSRGRLLINAHKD